MRSPAMAAEDSTDSPISADHSSFSAGGSASAATPVMAASPRNRGQSAAPADWANASRNASATARITSLLDAEREQLVAPADEERSIGRHRRRVDRAAHVHLTDHLQLAAGLEDGDVAVLVPQVDAAFDHERRPPDG